MRFYNALLSLLPLLGQVVKSQSNYAPLSCNANTVVDINAPIDTCTPFSQLVNETLSADPNGRIVVPCGTCSIVDYTDGSTIDLPNGLNIVGRLHFPTSTNVRITTTNVYVQGLFDLPSPLDTNNELTIHLYGTNEYWFTPYDGSTDARSVGKKPFVVAGGTIHIQAVSNECESWTQLITKVDDYTLRVKNDFANCLSWNDEILVTSSTKTWDADSTRRITSIVPQDDGSDSTIITVDNAITRSLPGLLGPGESVYAVEVASLSRSVHFTADNDDPDGPHIGGHFMIGWTPNVEQVIAGVKIDNFGQGGILGRYPIHFHLSGVSPSTVAKNVIINSNHRCILIHDTDGTTVDNNVCYNHRGHGIATEVGTEDDNVFKYNLVARTLLLPAGQDNGQSDTKGAHNKHQATSYWIRNFNNEFIGNVAAGSSSLCWWPEMTKKKGRSTFWEKQKSTTPVSSFRDNVAHSCKEAGMVTYFRGWKPEGTHDEPGGVWDNFKVYKNPYNGFKFHQTGPIKIVNSLIADNTVGVMYGNGVWEVHLENTIVDGASKDWRFRLDKGCSNHIGIKHSSNRWGETPERSMAFTNTTFQNFCGSGPMFQFYYDSRSGPGMGDAVEMQGTNLLNVWEKNKPTFKCQNELRDNFLEDVDGVLGPTGKGPGYIIRNRDPSKAFLPPDACTPLWYSGSNEWGQCSAFCEGTFCLRFMRIKPFFGEWTTHTDMKLLLSNDEGTEFEYSSFQFKHFDVLLPAGNYHGSVYKADGTELMAREIEVYGIGDDPICQDFVTEADFTFATAPPTPSPTDTPTGSSVPTVTADPIVRIQNALTQRYLWTRWDGGFKGSEDIEPLTNTAITLVKKVCPNDAGYYYNENGLTSSCYLIKWESANGRRLFAKSGSDWKNGVGTSAGKNFNDQIWFIEASVCEEGTASGPCAILRNVVNGRTMYDNENLVVGAAAPTWLFEKTKYKWHLVDSTNGGVVDAAGLE